MIPGRNAAFAISLAILAAAPLPAQPADRQADRAVGRVQGKVVGSSDSRRHELPGVHVLLTSRTDPHHVYATASDGRGRFSLGSIVLGTYDLRAYRQGLGERLIENIDVKAVGSVSAEIVFSGTEAKNEADRTPDAGSDDSEAAEFVSISGTFSMASRKPVASGKIDFHRDGSREKSFSLPVKDGSFSASEIPAGIYDIRTSATGLLPLHLRRVRISGGTGRTFFVHLVTPVYPVGLPRERTEEWLPTERPIERPRGS